MHYLLLAVLISFTSVLAAQQPIPEVEALLARMTIAEKIGQLNLLTPGGGATTGAVVSDDVETKIRAGEVGGLFGLAGPDRIRTAQNFAINESRLGIPLFIGADIIHGYKTTFPLPLGLASSWDMQLIERTAQVAAREATADGINWNFSPMVDIARDPRWGRIAEGAGEDPYLGSAVAQAMVRGYQGSDLGADTTMLATVKHLALYGAAEGGRDYASVDMSRLKMYNQYLPPYQAAVDAGVASVMTSFNDVEGIPASGNKWLLTELLRDAWGFEGFVVSDYTSINEMSNHGLGDLQAVSALALDAGMDMDMVGEGFLTTLPASLEEGKVTEEQITTACRRILEAKYKLGLFEDPYRYLDTLRPARDILTADNRALARAAASRASVLLKNENATLPLQQETRIALIGPLADSQNNMLGTWAPTGELTEARTIRTGFDSVVPDVAYTYAAGANITDDTTLAKNANVFGPRVVIDERSPDVLLEEALTAARAADVVVAVVGEASEFTGEAGSRTDIQIPASQKKLIRALVETGKPVVLVLMSGRPLDISEELALPVSILQVWHPGVEAGPGVVDVLYGNYNPAGHLTASWPRNVGQIPVYHAMKRTGRPAPTKGAPFQKFVSNYLDAPNTPLLPFGYGLSYTTFTYSNPQIESEQVAAGDSVRISIEVTNTGDVPGEDVVQLYLRDVVRSVTPPDKTLKGFQKIGLTAGESRRVEFVLSPDDLKFYNSALDFVAEPGAFEVFVGEDAHDERYRLSFQLVE
ncbi:Beta-xylosidase [Neolewinella maritima]|uniref:beta-glucosidase n=1 Tax=Neolewinella maritima TaxID=1383882 RepID=A0ABM9B1G0_9BACT|nr:beta-glucosidase BglX [Neolewinella maritima]CAH1001170.1 Beta-xylosidase [Neolewinella maritima]